MFSSANALLLVVVVRPLVAVVRPLPVTGLGRGKAGLGGAGLRVYFPLLVKSNFTVGGACTTTAGGLFSLELGMGDLL